MSGGDNVTINVTNNGNEALEFPNSVLGLEIENLGTGDIFPLVSAQVITALEAGESRTFQFTYEELVSEIGTGTIEARVGGDGCLASTTFTLTSETTEPLTVHAIWDTVDGGTAPATFRLEADVTGGTEPYTYHWDFGDGQQETLEGSSGTRHTYENPGNYTATVTVTDATGQNASDTTPLILVAPSPTNDTGGVEPEPLRIEAELDPLDANTAPASYLFEGRTFGGTEPYTYSWDFGDGQQSDRQDVYHTYENPGTYIVTVTVTDATGQNASGSLSPLNIAPPPTNDTGGVTPEPLRAQANLDSTDIPFTHRFEANADGGTPPYTYHWDFGDGQEANVQNTRHTYDNPGTYTATLTVTDSAGQTASDSTEVIVQPAPPTTDEPTANETGGQ
jgi:PKD repeat protein